jgi:hypothetical protein
VTQYALPEDVLDYIKGLEKRIEKLEKLPRAGNTAIDDGAITVREAGVDKVILGKLPNGTYGLGMIQGGILMPMSQLAFGLTAARADASVTPARNTWVSDGALSRTATVTTGRLIVIVSARIAVGTGGTGTPVDGYYGFQLLGPTTVQPDFGRCLYQRYNGAGMDGVLQASWVDVQDGLANGSYTVTPYMYVNSVGIPANDATFSYRRVAVLPY